MRKVLLRLVSDMPDSNRNWKNRYFFIQGTDWMCRQEEWDSMPHSFDNTWGIVKDSGLVPFAFYPLFIYLLCINRCLFLSSFS